MSKMKWMMGIILAGLLIGGCGKDSGINEKSEEKTGQTEISVSSIELLKGGSIAETIVEDFSEDYYDEEVLKNMMLSEIAEFNKTSGDENISVDKFENKNGTITVVIKYPSADAYKNYYASEYGSRDLYYGTIADAYDAGYSLDVTLKSTKNEEETVGKEDLLQMGKNYILISSEPMKIKTFEKMLYVGENVEVLGKNKADLKNGENGEALSSYYIVFK